MCGGARQLTSSPSLVSCAIDFTIVLVCGFLLAAAVSAYPVRMRVISVLTDKEDWVTVAIIPQVGDKLEPMSAEKASRLRARLLQTTLHLVLRRLLQASPFGVKMALPDGTVVVVSPRLLLYQCDYPEERSIMGLKNQGSAFDCTQCMVPSKVSCTAAGLNHPDRPVLPTVDAQLKASKISDTRGYTRTVKDLMNLFGIRATVPELAAWAALGSGPRLLYKAPGFDELHVR